MDLLVTTEERFFRGPDGTVRGQSAAGEHTWGRYMDVFEGVRVMGRVRDLPEIPPDSARIPGGGVSVVPVPNYLGPMEYLWKAPAVRKAARCAFRTEDAVILRLPGQVSASLMPVLWRTGKPYGVELVADPFDVFGPGAVRHPLRLFFRLWIPRKLRRQCSAACGVSYVSGRVLVERYPPAPNAFSNICSGVHLPGIAFAPSPRESYPSSGTTTLITVGSLAQMYKGPDILLRSLEICVRKGCDLNLVLIGDGKHREELEDLARILGLRNHVSFMGQIPPGEPVIRWLDRADLFVLPSRTEGLPRAMVEAMARALPCIGTTVGGIPELLSAEDLVPPGDPKALADKILEVISDPGRMASMSARNLEKAREYREEVLRERRVAFYRHVRDATALWLDQRSAG